MDLIAFRNAYFLSKYLELSVCGVGAATQAGCTEDPMSRL